MDLEEEGVREALRQMHSRRTVGKLVLRVNPDIDRQTDRKIMFKAACPTLNIIYLKHYLTKHYLS